MAVLVGGGGIGMLATYIASSAVTRGELVSVFDDHTLDSSVISAVWPESRRNSPSVKPFVAFLAEIFDVESLAKR